jgi:hypothetical protein
MGHFKHFRAMSDPGLNIIQIEIPCCASLSQSICLKVSVCTICMLNVKILAEVRTAYRQVACRTSVEWERNYVMTEQSQPKLLILISKPTARRGKETAPVSGLYMSAHVIF